MRENNAMMRENNAMMRENNAMMRENNAMITQADKGKHHSNYIQIRLSRQNTYLPLRKQLPIPPENPHQQGSGTNHKYSTTM